jgi:hypothetical protein
MFSISDSMLIVKKENEEDGETVTAGIAFIINTLEISFVIEISIYKFEEDDISIQYHNINKSVSISKSKLDELGNFFLDNLKVNIFSE